MPFSSRRGQSQSQESITKRLSMLGIIAACVFAIAIPCVYYTISIPGRQHTLTTLEAAFFVKDISRIIQDRPDLWEYESVRLKEFISQSSPRGETHEREIRTVAGKVVAKTDFIETRPFISVSMPFFDSGRSVGSIIVRHSIRTEVITTILLGILSSLIGYLSYFIFRTYPIRRLEQTLTDLRLERDKSDKTLYAIDDGVITVDHQGRILFINRVAESLVGMDASEVVGRLLEEVYVLRQGQEDQLGEKGAILIGKGGNECTIEEVRTPLTEVESDNLGFVIVFRDITEREQIEKTQLFLLQCGYLHPDEDFFASLARYLAENIGADCVCIDRLQGDGLTASTVAIYSDGKFEDNVECPLGNTPCGNVVGKTICSFPKDVRHLFPQDIVLQEMQAESYLGTTLWSVGGKPIGLISIIGRKPLKNPHLAESILKLVGIRAAGELERRLAQEELRASEEKFVKAFQASPQILVIASLEDSRLLEVNDSFISTLGYSREEAIGRTTLDFGLWVSQEERTKFISAVQKDRSVRDAEVVLRTKAGGTLTMMVSAEPIHVGGKACMLYTLDDITERKRVGKALQESERFLNDAQRLAHIGSWAWVIATDAVKWSEELYRINGRDPETPAPTFMEMSSSYTPESWKRLRAAVEKILLNGEPYELELDLVRQDGAIIATETRGEATYDNMGKMIGLQGTVHDVNDLKQLEKSKRGMEDRLRRAEKMEALGQLAGGVAHDLNNVLGVLVLYAELLVERLPAGTPLRGYATDILNSSTKGAAIIQDLLTLARRGVTAVTVVDFNDIISNFLTTPEFDRLKVYHPQVNFKTSLGQDLLRIKGSSVHLEKTVMNLLSNAAEAIPRSGEVDIRTENRYLDQAVPGYDTVAEGDYVVLTVSDTGTGISSEDMDKMFEPFYTKKKMGRSGTGLGLAIVWGTVKDHHGYVDVQSMEGKGTTFTIYFPATREKMSEDIQKVPVEQYMGHGESILVVDDVQEQRQVATTILMQLGYKVNAVSSGEEAVEYLRKNRADILVLDMIMDPGIDGLETYKRVMEINPHQKAIIVSGFSETDRVQEAQNLGAGAYVKKPYLKEKIGMAIRDELARKKIIV